MEGVDKDFLFVAESVNELKDYLLSPHLFWPISLGKNKFPARIEKPQLTPGTLLFSLKRLEANPLTSTEKEQVSDWEIQIKDIFDQWRSHWTRKVVEEFHRRVNLWNRFIGDLKKDTAGNQGSFGYEVRNRVILQLLTKELDTELDSSVAALRNADSVLKALTVAGDFIWETRYKPVFPVDPFWYLYAVIH